MSSMELKVKHALRNDESDACITFALSHGRTVEVSEPLDPVETIAALSEALVMLTPDPAHMPEGLRKFADALKAGAIGDILDDELGRETEPPRRGPARVVLEMIYEKDPEHPRTDVRLTVRMARGGGRADAWMAMAEAMVAVAIFLDQEPVGLLHFVADHPPGAREFVQLPPEDDAPKARPQRVWFPARGGQA